MKPTFLIKTHLSNIFGLKCLIWIDTDWEREHKDNLYVSIVNHKIFIKKIKKKP